MDISEPTAPQHIEAIEYVSRIRALLRKGGVERGLPRKVRDRWILLHAISRGFEPDEILTEIEATGRIGAFLTASAPHWRLDRVTLRRALVDEGFLDRRSDGTGYRLSRRHEHRVGFDRPPEIASILDLGTG